MSHNEQAKRIKPKKITTKDEYSIRLDWKMSATNKKIIPTINTLKLFFIHHSIEMPNAPLRGK
jgi:hypothetical protein